MLYSSAVTIAQPSVFQAQTADEILDQAQNVRTVERSVQRVKMVLVSKSGSEREREMAIRARRDGDARCADADLKHVDCLCACAGCGERPTSISC